jgi:hypothetical protein
LMLGSLTNQHRNAAEMPTLLHDAWSAAPNTETRQAEGGGSFSRPYIWELLSCRT